MTPGLAAGGWKSLTGLARGRRTASRTTTSPPTTTRSSIRRSSPATRRSTSSRSTASRTSSSTRARAASGTARARPATSRRSSGPRRRFWGSLPYDKYVFFNLITESGGGLEHKNSTVLMASRWATRTREATSPGSTWSATNTSTPGTSSGCARSSWGRSTTRTRCHTRSLWVAEGITDYYGRLLVRRAGLCTRDEYLAGTASAARSAPG